MLGAVIMNTILIVCSCVFGACLVLSYVLYRYAFIRGKEPVPPVPGTGKTEARRFFSEHYAERMSYLERWGYETVTVTNFQGKRLVGYLFRAKRPTERVALCIHGYRNAAFNEYLYHAPMYLEHLGMDLLLVDDQAHGASEGKRIGFSWNDRRDCLQWVDWITGHMGPDKEVLLQGISMGAATVLNAAGESSLSENVRWVVADCAFSSLKVEILQVMKQRFHLPAFPLYYMASGFCRLLNGFFCGTADVAKQTAKIKVPVLFIHGGEDRFVPTEMVHTLYEACNTPKDLLIVPSARHGESFLLEPETYESMIRKLLEKGDG